MRYRLSTATPWAPAGHEVAWEQFALRPPQPATPAGVDDAAPLTTAADKDAIIVRGPEVAMSIGRTTGLLQSLSFRGRELLAAPFTPSFWRAPTDNDRGNNMPGVSGAWRRAGESFRPASVRLERLAPGVVRVVASGTLASVGADYGFVYTLHNTGDLVIETTYDAGDRRLPELPRFGITARLVPGFDTLTWYGPGPAESYSDRAAQRVGVYTATVDDHHFPYSQPQETGHHTGLRWVALASGEVALFASGGPRLGVNVSHYATADVESSAHHHELRRLDEVVLNLDLAQRGLGGDDSWGALPHQEFRLDATRYVHRIRLRPYDVARDTPMALSKRPPPP